MSRLSVSGTVVMPSNPATRQRWAASSRSTGRAVTAADVRSAWVIMELKWLAQPKVNKPMDC